MSLTVTSTRVTEPVTPEELETHARIPAGEKEYLAALVSAARLAAEHETGQVIPEQQFTWVTNELSDGLVLPVYPVVSVASISYVDADGATQVLSSDVYTTVTEMMQTRLERKPNQDWPDLQSDGFNRVTIVINAGMASVPDNIKQAIMLISATAYENRQDEVIGESGKIKVDQASSFFLRPFKRHSIG